MDGEGDEWDPATVAELFPGSQPTHGLSWDDIRTEVTNHEWIVLEGRHYDAECPEGTGNLFELPLVRRIMEVVALEKAGEDLAPSP